MKNKQRHLTLDERIIIQKGIESGATISSIASTVGKHKSTIGKEIRLHRIKKQPSRFPLQCRNYKKCKHHRTCHNECVDYSLFTCQRRDRSPGACNGCAKYNSCRYDKYRYSAELAQKSYKETLVDSRFGVNLTVQEAIALGTVIKPLIEQGQSPYMIITNHPELGISEKTMYNYIQRGVFECVNLINIDLRMKTSRRMIKNADILYKKRKDNKYLLGRTYCEFIEYTESYPNLSIVEMDTVYNDIVNGPFIQTFKLLDYSLLLAVYHTEKTASAMLSGINKIHQFLGDELFFQCFEIIKTDRGSEFSNPDAIEVYQGIKRTRVFYCDPMQSGQKGSLENNHKELRYILPKGLT